MLASVLNTFLFANNNWLKTPHQSGQILNIQFEVSISKSISNILENKTLRQEHSPNIKRKAMYSLDLGFPWDPFYKVEVVVSYLSIWIAVSSLIVYYGHQRSHRSCHYIFARKISRRTQDANPRSLALHHKSELAC